MFKFVQIVMIYYAYKTFTANFAAPLLICELLWVNIFLISYKKPKAAIHKYCLLSRSKANGSQGQQPALPPPAVRNLVHQQGLSALHIEAQRLSAWEQIFVNCSTSRILTQESLTKRITPDILLTGMGECVGVHSSQSKEMLPIHRATSCTDNLNGKKGQIKRK